MACFVDVRMEQKAILCNFPETYFLTSLQMSYFGVKQIQIAAVVSLVIRHLLHKQKESIDSHCVFIFIVCFKMIFSLKNKSRSLLCCKHYPYL